MFINNQQGVVSVNKQAVADKFAATHLQHYLQQV